MFAVRVLSRYEDKGEVKMQMGCAVTYEEMGRERAGRPSER
jgi:hypothetical protein